MLEIVIAVIIAALVYYLAIALGLPSIIAIILVLLVILAALSRFY